MSKLMEYLGYHASVEYDPEDRIFIGKVCGITDSLNFHGTTVDELENMFHQSIDNYLELCKELGKKPDKEYKGSFNVRISPELHKQGSIKATENKLTLNQFVARALEEALEPRKETETIFCIPYTVKKDNWLPTVDMDKMYQAEDKNTVEPNIVWTENGVINYVS